jgi:hypothetical protein
VNNKTLIVYRYIIFLVFLSTTLFAQEGLSEAEFSKKIAEYNQKIVGAISDSEQELEDIDQETAIKRSELELSIASIEQEGADQQGFYKAQIDSLTQERSEVSQSAKDRIDLNVAAIDSKASAVDSIRQLLDTKFNELTNKQTALQQEELERSTEAAIEAADTSDIQDSLIQCSEGPAHGKGKPKKHHDKHKDHHHNKHHGKHHYKPHHKPHHRPHHKHGEICKKIAEAKERREQRRKEREDEKLNKEIEKVDTQVSEVKVKLEELHLVLTEKIEINQSLITFEEEQAKAVAVSIQSEIDVIIALRNAIPQSTAQKIDEAHAGFDALYKSNEQRKSILKETTIASVEEYKALLLGLIPNTQGEE